MKSIPDMEDAHLILKLYELRREERMREARDFVIGPFSAASLDELAEKYPYGGDESAYYRMVLSYWDMVGTFVSHGLLNPDLLFDTTAEFMAVWEKTRHLAPEMRQLYKNPLMMKNIEDLANRYEEYMKAKAPEFLAAYRERMKALTAQK